MKYQNRNIKKYYINNLGINPSNNVISRKKIKLNSRWQMIYDVKYKKYKLVMKKVDLDAYVFYLILNTNVIMEIGVAASMIARSIITLYNKLVTDLRKNICIDLWHQFGENVIVLQGYGHKHLKYLEREAKFAALGKHAIYHQNHAMLALSIFGRKEEIEDIFDGLSYLR